MIEVEDTRIAEMPEIGELELGFLKFETVTCREYRDAVVEIVIWTAFPVIEQAEKEIPGVPYKDL